MLGYMDSPRPMSTKYRFWGSIVGTVLGFTFGGGPVGAVLGGLAGHAYDRRREPATTTQRADYISMSSFSGTPKQTVFTGGIINLSAKLCKIDGRVNRAEIDAFKRTFQISPAQENNIGRLFDAARRSASDFEPHAFKMAQTFSTNPSVLEQVLTNLLVIAAADGQINPSEGRFLKQVAYIFHFGPDEFKRIVARAGVVMPDSDSMREQERANASEPFAILGIASTATNDDIKAAYRNLIRKHHPDRLAAEGKSADTVNTANEQMKRINIAYDTICKVRGIK